ncbi:MAG: endonuclease/exonuclease/phosphatase family protein, partial [Burkholderiales bacterium]
LHCVCVHLALTARGRSRQLERLRQRIERLVPAHAPLIIAGDFNDWHWRYKATHELAHPLNMHEVFELVKGLPARSFPAMLPLFRLDRIYVRGFRVSRAHVHHGPAWGRISDHAVLTTTLERL